MFVKWTWIKKINLNIAFHIFYITAFSLNDMPTIANFTNQLLTWTLFVAHFKALMISRAFPKQNIKYCCLKLLIRCSMIKSSYLLQTFEHLTIKWPLSSIWHNFLHKCPQESLTLHFNWHPVNIWKSKPLDALPITLLWIWHFNNNFGPTLCTQ